MYSNLHLFVMSVNSCSQEVLGDGRGSAHLTACLGTSWRLFRGGVGSSLVDRGTAFSLGATVFWLPLSASIWLPGAGFGHYGRNICFSLRNLPFGFLARHVRGAFPPDSVGGILASSPAKGNRQQTKKGPCFSQGPHCLLAPQSYRNWVLGSLCVSLGKRV